MAKNTYVSKQDDNAPVVVVESVVTKEAACSMLGITERTLDELLRSGKIKARKKSSRWVILHSDLINYIKS